jgi:hypothetical protein
MVLDRVVHSLEYMPGAFGGSPHWYCPCGGWRFEAKPMPHRKTGNNKAEAQRSYDVHYEQRSPL